MSEQTYTLSRSELIALLEDTYCEGYACGWKGDWGAEQHLDAYLSERAAKAVETSG